MVRRRGFRGVTARGMRTRLLNVGQRVEGTGWRQFGTIDDALKLRHGHGGLACPKKHEASQVGRAPIGVSRPLLRRARWEAIHSRPIADLAVVKSSNGSELAHIGVGPLSRRRGP